MTTSMAWYIFSGFLFAGIILHGTAWQTLDMYDESQWLAEAQHFASDHWRNPHERLFYGYPATALLLLVRAADALGATPLGALRGSVTVLLSGGIASVAALCFYLRPHSWWWLAAGSLLLFNRLYFLATPPSAIVSPWLVAATLIALYLYEHPSASRRWLLFLGTILGGCASVRLDITTAAGGLILTGLVFRHRGRLTLVALSALSAFFISNPYMWVMPGQHLIDIATKVGQHYHRAEPRILTVTQLLSISPLAVVGLAVAIGSLAYFPLRPLVPRPYLWYLIFATIVLSAVLLTSAYQPQWYFHPLALLWEVFLPLLMLGFISHLQFPTTTPVFSAILTRHAPLLLVALLAGGYALTFFHYYYLPEVTFVLP